MRPATSIDWKTHLHPFAGFSRRDYGFSLSTPRVPDGKPARTAMSATFTGSAARRRRRFDLGGVLSSRRLAVGARAARPGI